MNTHETYVSLETAKLLKKAGFDWGCDTFYGLDVRYKGKSIDEDEEYELKVRGNGKEIEYVDGGMVYNFYHTNKGGEDFGGYSRPTLAVTQRWLIENYRAFIEVQARPLCDLRFVFILVQPCGDVPITDYNSDDNEYDTYEEALEAGIKKCLTILLEEKQ